MTDKWLCPVCGGILTPDGGSYRCDEGHCYDIAKADTSISSARTKACTATTAI